MKSTRILNAALAALTVSAVSITALRAQETLSVDIGPNGQNVQSNFVGWSIGASGANTLTGVTTTFTNFGGFTASLLCAYGGDCGVAVRVRSPLATGPVGNLVQDAVKNPLTSQLELAFSGLRAGFYQITTYHHDGGTAGHGTMDILLTDANGEQQLVADELLISYGNSNIDWTNVTKATFFLHSDGVKNVLLDMVVGDNKNNPEVWLNGFVLESVQGDKVSITSQPNRVALAPGSPASVSVTASAASGTTNFVYQWQKNGTNITGATASIYNIPSVSAADAGSYRCVVRISGSAADPAISDAATLRLYTPVPLPSVASGTLLVHLQAETGVQADASGVTAWLDQSPNQYVFASRADGLTLFNPTQAIGLSGNPVIRFGGNAMLSSSVPIQLFPNSNSPLTVIIAFDTFANSAQKCLVNWNIKDDLGNRGNMELSSAVNSAAGCFGIHMGCGQADVIPGGSVPNNTWEVMTIVIKSNGVAPQNVSIYQNGGAWPLNATGPGGCVPNKAGWLDAGQYVTGSSALDIGGRNDGGTTFDNLHTGDIGEVLVYQGNLSDTDRATIQDYLGAKYGLNVAPPPINLQIQRAVQVSYPVFGSGGLVLRSTDSLTPPVNWVDVNVAPVISGGYYIYTIPIFGNQYYDLFPR
ncbi:MAG: immunoglobulin domain-containing protein [Verrucomicrobia bacterium]|nr:immunoglobulin domain-containing protein [Verrucomicrobiota bacterium]